MIGARLPTCQTSPTNYVSLYFSGYCSRQFETTDNDGSSICTTITGLAEITGTGTKYADKALVTTLPNDAIVDGTFAVPPNWPIMQRLGLDPSWSCTGVPGPIPFANIPILSLTATSTIQQDGNLPTESPSKQSQGQPLSQTVSSTSFPIQTKPPTPKSSPSSFPPNLDSSSPSASSSVEIGYPVTSVTPYLSGAVATVAESPIETSRTVVYLPISSVIAIAGLSITPDVQGIYHIGTTDLIPGSAPITVSGTVFFLASSATALVIGTSTVPLQPSLPSFGQYSPKGSTPLPGESPVTVSGIVYSRPTSGTALQVIASLTPIHIYPPAITLGGQPITANSLGDYIFDGQTLAPGGAPLTISGTAYSLFPSDTALEVGHSSIPLTGSAPVITVGGEPVTASSGGYYIIDDQTLAPGGTPITISGTSYSLFPSGTALEKGHSTIPLTGSASMITLGGQTITANAEGNYVVDGQTLTPGGQAITVSGTVVSMAANDQTMVVGGETEVLASTTTNGIGGLIWSGLGGGATNVSGSTTRETSPVVFLGGVAGGNAYSSWKAWMWMGIVTLVSFVVL